MSEIDKLINQAFPDELRDVEPIDVDEDAILAMTLDALGLESSTKAELPELIPARRRARTLPREEKTGPNTEYVEVPVVVRRRWLDWAGWAIAACLVLILAVNWGPWLINNLDFGIGPRSSGDGVVSGSSSVSSNGVKVENSFGASVGISRVGNEGNDEVSITLVITPIFMPEELDLDQFSFEVEGEGGGSITRLGRSSEGNQVTLRYYLNGERHLVLTVRRQARLLMDGGGERVEMGFTYEDIDKIEMNLNTGEGRSLLKNGHYTFARYDVVMEPAQD